MVKVAIIGPAEIVRRVEEEGKKFPELDFIALAYIKEYEALDAAVRISQQVDVILFTGPVPYMIAREHENSLNALLLYIGYGGTGLYRVLFQMLKDGSLQLEGENRFSVDFLNKEEVTTAFEELDIDHSQIQMLEFQQPVSSDEIVEHHVRLWRSGTVTCVITCLYSVYKKLLEMQIPAYCIVPTRSAIQTSLNLALAKGNEKTSDNNQIAVSIVSFEANVPLEEKEKWLAAISATLQTSWQKSDDETYLFYTTKGFAFLLTNGFSHVPYFMAQDSCQLYMGLGIGDTAIDAAKRALYAHLKSKSEGGNTLYIIKNENAVTRVGGQNGSRPMEYQSRTYDDLIRKIAAETGLSISTLSKIQYVSKALGKRDVTAVELAGQLNITIRSARRILKALSNEGYANVAGDEQPLVRGRPRLIYKLQI